MTKLKKNRFKQQLTVKLRLRDKHTSELNRQAHMVNLVWNYCNEAQRHVLRWDRWLSKYDLQKLTIGSNKELNIHSHTIKRVCDAYVQARTKHHKPYLRWRGYKSLGWVPFNTGHVTFNGKCFTFRGVLYQTMHLRSLLKPNMKIGAGSFNQDAKGRWYINCPINIECANHVPVKHVGIDFGLKELATLSNGNKIEAPQFYRKSEQCLAKTQRARKVPKRIRVIHSKVANRRKDFLHKQSTKIAKEYGFIVVGNVSPYKLTKTHLAKSVLDVGWSSFKRMLSYKAITHGGMCLEVNEAYTTQTCSMCGSRPPSSPRGITGLSNRMWRCDDCGTVHDRDVNAARNILAIGLNSLIGGAHV